MQTPLIHIKLEDIRPSQARGNGLVAALLRQAGVGKSRAWVAKMLPGMRREFLDAQMDYSSANSVGSRGVYKHYFLDPDAVYDISEPTSWKRTHRRYCRFVDGKEVEMIEEDVEQWLELTSE